ncbi:MAG: DNA gyrase inhibitor YacG [Rhodospirillaceae bacterium]|jgi:uncharacterized protein|nr:DNA gyrase inhibitor YacG [Rhodospirillaceae bacterium]
MTSFLRTAIREIPTERQVTETGRKAGKCPICGSESRKDFRPFCSRRCADRDLASWFNGSYSVPVVELDEADLDEIEEAFEDQINTASDDDLLI